MAQINKAVVEKLCGKLEQFSSTLSEDERAAFQSMLEGSGLPEDALNQVSGGAGFQIAAAPSLRANFFSAKMHQAAAACW
jgi:hypothetical protein